MSLRIEPLPDYYALLGRFASLGDDFEGDLMIELDRVGMNAVQEVQNVVHVDTGALQQSGRYDIFASSLGPELEITFGDDFEVDYAAYEEMYHPYLVPTIENSGSLFLGAMGDAWESL